MRVSFTRTAQRRYRVSVEGPGVVPSYMEPAPGYDSRLPHDMAHFVVENELGIAGGVFGQLANGGHANTFRPITALSKRKVALRGKRMATLNRDDAVRSEKVVGIALLVWTNGLTGSIPMEAATVDDITRVCREFDAVSAVWSQLRVGESMTLVWRGGAAGRTARHQRSHKRS
jgi:hypothetical protein